MSEPDFTILGCRGMVGEALTAALRVKGHRVQAVDRLALPGQLASGRHAGRVISCIGLTGDFRTRPLDATEAHVGVAARCLAGLRCESFLYLSSTRVYALATHEDAPLPCVPADPSDLYNLTKLTGEALCLADPRAGVRVARLSNIYSAEPGAGTFLGQIIASGRDTGRVLFRQGPDSEKDYVSLADVVRLLPAIATSGRHRLYNLAAGRNTSHASIAAILSAVPGWRTEFAPDAPTIRFPRIDIGRLRAEFSAPSGDLASDLAELASGHGISVGEP
jgi:nucleoside-diphosphate-sugar epimerase